MKRCPNTISASAGMVARIEAAAICPCSICPCSISQSWANLATTRGTVALACEHPVERDRRFVQAGDESDLARCAPVKLRVEHVKREAAGLGKTAS